jgi:disulfide bond formation protein DsbB
MTPNLRRARALALLIPAALLAGAWGSQLIGHLYPCEMCHWQRWPHYAALVLALLAFVRRAPVRLLVALAAIAIATSGAIGVAHAGVEYHWWNGFTPCTSTMSGGGSLIDRLMKAPIVRCDVAQWRLFGISLAGFNAIISLTGAAAVFYFLAKRDRAG